MNAEKHKWTFFIAHAGSDSEFAEALYERLKDRAPTFLDSRCLLLGADWDEELKRAQDDALISVVLVSENTGKAYYQREEIAAAIDLARDEGKEHRVVPVFLNSDAHASKKVPYGLRLKHGRTLDHKFGLDELAEELLSLPQRLREQQEAQGQPGLVPSEAKRRQWLSRRPRIAWQYGGAAAAVLGLGVLVYLVFFTAPQPPRMPHAPPTAETPISSSPAPLPQPTTVIDAESEDRCVKVEYLSPNLIPHYLLNSMGSKNFPYWLKIVAKNDCREDRILTLRFERGDNASLENPPQTREFTIPMGEQRAEPFNPRFVLTSQHTESVSFHWSIEDENRRKIKADSITTEIVPPMTVAWDLQKPSTPGKRIPVEPEYLLGSLKAWILKPPQKITDLGRACRTTSRNGVILEGESAIRACYQSLFYSDNPIQVSESPIRFPAGLRQCIRRHIDFFEQRQNKASSLEAALLFTAVMDSQHIDGVDLNLVMLIGPVEGSTDADRKTTYIAWREPGQPWRAFDLRLSNSLAFETNVASASNLVGMIISYNSEISDAIDKKGAGFSTDKKFAAINFRKVPPEYLIRALP